MFVFRIGIACALALILTACPDEPEPTDTFDRKQMLTDVADGLIIPAYDSLHVSNIALQQAIDAFIATPTEATLNVCRVAWKQTLLYWNDAGLYNFGPAEGLYGTLTENVATFPADTALIEQYILNADTLFQNFDRDTRGYYALDYLLFFEGAGSVVQRFTDDTSHRRSAYLRSVVRDVIAFVSEVRIAWSTSYRSEFISRNGTDAGSSTSLLFNHMNMNYELAKNYKLALPLGKRVGQTNTEPDKVEALYSAYSIPLLKRHYGTVMNVWHGRDNNGKNFLGFEEYIASTANGDRLITDTKLQFDSVLTQLNALSDSESLRDIITANPTRLEPLFEEMQKLTHLIKSELSSQIGIAITYSSGDGD